MRNHWRCRKLIKDVKATFVKELSKCETEEEFNDLTEKIKKVDEMLKNTSWKVSPDTLITVGGSLLTVLLILNFEKLNIVSTKALGFIIKGRV